MEEVKENSIPYIESLCEKLNDLKNTADRQKIELSSTNEQITETEKQILTFLEQNELPRYASKYGTVSTTTRSSVKVPTGENKVLFLEYLKEQGLFDEVVGVNSQWLNGYYRREAEAAIERGEFAPAIPGLEEPKVTVAISFRRGK